MNEQNTHNYAENCKIECTCLAYEMKPCANNKHLQQNKNKSSSRFANKVTFLITTCDVHLFVYFSVLILSTNIIIIIRLESKVNEMRHTFDAKLNKQKNNSDQHMSQVFKRWLLRGRILLTQTNVSSSFVSIATRWPVPMYI